MKKITFFLSAMIALISASCSQDEPVTPLSGVLSNKINFTVTSDNGTRASSAYTTGLDITKLTVSAWVRTPDKKIPNYAEDNSGNLPYFLNDVLTREKKEGETGNTGSFSYASDARYWPQNGETLDFYAVVDPIHPFAFDTYCSSGLRPGISEQIEQKGIDYMPDMLYATTFDQKWNGDRDKPQQNVSLSFNHAFAKLVVKAQVKNSNLHVVITDMRICGIAEKGFFYFPQIIDQDGAPVVGPAKWEVSTEYKDVECFSNKEIILDKAESDTQTLISDKDGGMLMIPNKYDGRNTSVCQTYIELSGYAYNIHNLENGFGENDVLIYGKPGDSKPIPQKMLIPIEFDWKMGTLNTYTIIFDCGNGGSSDVNPNAAFIRIGYEVEVEDWATGENIETEYKK